MIKKVTIQEIAREMDLSRNTVAKALAGSDAVAPDTRMMIIKTAWEMGYQKISESMLEECKLTESRSKIRTVVVLARSEPSVFWNSIIVGISDELNRSNCRMRLNFVTAEDEMNLTMPVDLGDDIDAIILMSIFASQYTEQILEKKLPTVLLDSPIGEYSTKRICDSIVCEGRSSIAAITAHLAEQGMTKIGFIGNINYCESMLQRYRGFIQGMETAGIETDDSIIFTKRMPDMYSHAEVEQIIESFPFLPQAIVCANDDIALKVMRAYVNRGIRCPRDIAITGFDNEEVLTQVEPKLTTVMVHNRLIGRRLVQQLMWRIFNPDFPSEKILISTEPIFRKSSQRPNKNIKR